MKTDTMIVGAAGELRVMSELMLRGFNPAKTYLDNGIDLILENGKTIQVKTAHGSDHKDKKNPPWLIKQYNFAFQNWKNKHHIKGKFAICWCMEDNLFLIIPTEKIKTTLLQYSPQWENTWLTQYLNNWEILT